VAEYSYDGRNFRIVKKTYDGGELDETRHFYYNRQWQCLEERIDGSTKADRQFVWGLRYIDDLILRDRNADENYSTGDLGKSSSGLEERLYALQDPNWNVAAISDTTGTIAERYAYDAYGRPTVLTGTFGSRASSSYAWETRYAGYRLDAETNDYHVRNRNLQSHLGRWDRSDPGGFAGHDNNLKRYAHNRPVGSTDPRGLVAIVCGCQSTGMMVASSFQVETDCQGGAATCCDAACDGDDSVRWTGYWRVKGIWGRYWRLDVGELCRRIRSNPRCAACCCEDVLGPLVQIAQQHEVQNFPDNCYHWVNKFPKNTLPKGYKACFSLQNRLFEYGYATPFGRLRHCAIKVITCDQTVFYLDNGWWGGGDHVFAPDEIGSATDVGEW